jgi:hypothetical protein
MIEHTHFLLAHFICALSFLKKKNRALRRFHVSPQLACMETGVFVTRGFGNMYYYLCPSSSLMFLKSIQHSSACCCLSIFASSFRS